MVLLAEQRLIFDISGLNSTIKYLEDRTQKNFQALMESPGNIFAYRHYQWSNMDTETKPQVFWAKILAKITDDDAVIRKTSALKSYLLSQSQSRWLPGVLEYLPKGHKFDSKIYLNIGIDNIAYGEDVALNLNHAPFQSDHNEAVYYLMHELAHAGYLKYHEMPALRAPRTWRELSDNVMFLTHLEGMGVLTPLKLRSGEGILNDPDYIALSNPEERKLRVRNYFEKLEGIQSDLNRSVEEKDFEIYDHFSGKHQRLWYITGCHMAQVIEEKLGVETLRELVKEGSKTFFEKYRELQKLHIE